MTEASKLSGKYGNLTVLDRADNNKFGTTRWNCLCDCGTSITLPYQSVKNGKHRGCILNRSKSFVDLSGQKFGRLTVLGINRFVRSDARHSRAYYNCVCECKNKCVIDGWHLRLGRILSCGCYHREITRKLFYAGNECFSKQRIGCIITSAKRRCIKTVSSGELLNITQKLWIAQNKRCALCNIEMLPMIKNKCKSNRNNGVSLDRIDSSIGYIESNLHLTCAMCNLIKINLSLDELDYFIKNTFDINRVNYSPCISQSGPKFNGYKNISGKYFSQIKRGAASRKIMFDLSIEDIWNKYIDQGCLCAISNIPIDFCTNGKHTASIDRINSELGYSADNIHIVHKTINNMKWDFKLPDFIDKLKLIAIHRGFI